jgi:hypothetical protein
MSNDLGIDRSGNNNSWTVTNLSYSDQMLDSPTNNFATLNPLDKNGGTLSEGNLKLDATTSWIEGRSTLAVSSGKWYYEVYIINSDAFSTGLRETGYRVHSGLYWAHTSFTAAAYGQVYGYGHNGTTNYQVTSGSNSSFTGSTANGDVLGFEIDLDSGTTTLKWNKNGVAQTTLYSSLAVAEYAIGWESYDSDLIFNFGQDSSFAGAKTAQGNQDSNSIGDFYYTPPTGFLALCTSNLPAVAVIPSEHFNAVIYTGDGDGSSKTISGVGFQPDFIWIKDRSTALDHNLSDAVRGVTKNLFSNTTGAETTDAESIQSFNADGFTVGNANNINNDHPYVAWNWKAGNATLGTGDFTQGNLASTCSRNVDAGFSIVSYTGNATNAATIGHGLSKAPDMVIVKNRDRAAGWHVGGAEIGNGSTQYLNLHTTGAIDDATTGFQAFTSTTFQIGTDTDWNASGEDIIAYCFHSVDGYSKVGSYTGNGNADGTFIYTGFRPRFILTKPSSYAHNWTIIDTERDTYNPVENFLHPNLTNAEIDLPWIDIVSNGFKFRNTHVSINGSYTYIYLAFSEVPFKFANAR